MASGYEIPTLADVDEAKKNMDSITEFIESEESTLLDQYGNTRKTLKGVEESTNYIIGWNIVGDFSTTPESTSINDVLTSKSISGYEDALWRTNQTLPYTPTGSDPTQSPELGKWVVVAQGELKSIARSLNVLDSEVIYSTDTITVLDNVFYIYDPVNQKIWSKPVSVGVGETILSVVGNVLTTSADTYTLVTINKSGVEFEVIADIDNENSIGGKVSLLIGDSVAVRDYATGNNSGVLFFKVVASGTGTADGGKYIDLPTLGLQLEQNMKLVPSIKDFGAVGDGVTNNTVAIQAALTYGNNVAVPEGTFFSNALTRNDGLRLLGAGIGRSILEFEDTNGITVTSPDDDHPVYVSNISFHQKGEGVNTALIIDNSGQISGGVVQNRTSPRLKIENVALRGSTDVITDGWLAGITCTDVIHAVIDGLHFEGYYSSTPDLPASTHAMRFDGSGAPVEFTITNSWAFFAVDALRVIDCEGVFVSHNNFVAVRSGIRFDPSTVEPQLQVTDNHINAYESCIVAANMIDSNISNNLFFARNDATANVVGLQFSATSFTHVKNNTFVNNSGYDLNGIVVSSGGEDLEIKGNIFRSATTAILLQTGSSGVKVGYNTFGAVTTEISDLGTNNIVTKSTQAIIGSKTDPDGLQEKWGSSNVTLNATGDGSITFAEPFDNAFFMATISNGDVAVVPTASFIANQGASSTTTLNFSVRPNPGAITVRANWIAKGN